MSDHEFEKQVEQRMDELKLRPSDAVWAGVEKELRREKRRRRTLLWLPILGVLLTAGGYLIYSGTGTSHDAALVKNQPAERTVAPSASDAHADATASATTPAPSNAPASEKTAPVNVPASSSSTIKPNESLPGNSTPSDKSEKAATVNADATPAASNDRSSATEKNNTVDKRIGDNSQTISGTVRKAKRDKKSSQTTSDDEAIVIPAAKAPGQKNIVTNKDSVKIQVDSNAIVYSRIKPSTPFAIDDSYYSIKVDRETAIVPPVETKLQGRIVSKAYPEVSKWQWGVSAGGGVSNISEGSLFNLLNSVRVEDLTNAGPAYNGIPPAPAPEPSAIEPGALYSAGAFVQRNISPRLSLAAGLQYSYWTVKTTVGRKEESARAVNYSNFDQQVVASYYRADLELRDYTNRYHFVELPLRLSFRFNNSRRAPLVLDGGVSFAQLLNTNALHFDGISRVYFEDDNFFKRLQVGLNAGLNIGLRQNSKHPIWVGPNLRYFASGLLKNDISSNSQHLWSFGINAKMLLKK